MWRRDAAAVGVAGVALGDIHLRFTWQAWYLVTSTSTLAWQAWHLWHWAGSGGALGFRCGAGTPWLLAWQAWHLETSIFISRGRLATSTFAWQLWRVWQLAWRHPSSFHVAGVVLTRNLSSHNLLTHNVWRRDAAAVGVAGVALGDIHFRFTWQAWYLVTSTSTLAWQAWHLWHWAGSGGALGFRCGAGTPRLLAWQAWHLETSIFVSRGRRATSTFAWQLWHVWQLAWQAWHLEISTFVSLGRRGTW